MIHPSASSESIHIRWSDADQMRSRSDKLDFLASGNVFNKPFDISTGNVAASQLSFDISDEFLGMNLIKAIKFVMID